MRLTIATEEGETYNVDVDSMELENFKALLEAEVRESNPTSTSLDPMPVGLAARPTPAR
jgi:hypothetical protein